MKTAGDGRPKLYSLELGRFIAALMVMLCHVGYFCDDHTSGPAQPFLGGISFPGQLGVQYFFVLSGFVMISAHHGDFGNIAAIPKFWWRRVCRIYPAYWLALIIPVYFAFGTLTPGQFATVALLSPWHDHELILAAWTLRYELVFYIILGLGMLPYIGKPFLAFWIFFTFWRWSLLDFLPYHPPFLFAVNHVVATHGDKFAAVFEIYFYLGLAAGLAYVKCRFGPRLSASLLLAGSVLFCLELPQESWGIGYGRLHTTVGMSVALACILLGLAGLERAGWIRLGRSAARLGMISYPLYVVHVPLIQLADHILHGRMLNTPQLYAAFVLMCLAALTVATLVTILFDQPVQRALRRITRRIWRGQGAAPGLALPAL